VSSPSSETPRRPPDNLPLELSSFIGREREVAEVKRLLGDNRLLTLSGAGGCGKTRLALAVAFEVVPDFEDGAWWVGLASLSDPDVVPQVVASALVVREAPGRTPTEALVAHLTLKRSLLVLDNCEHLIEECAALADTLLRSCPSLKILTTSREALGVAGETAWPVPALSLPDPHTLLSLKQLRRYEAIRLFVERAKAVAPSFELTEDNATAVVRVCRRLDGIPLAIELAAARVRVLSVEQIASRLEDSFRLLKTESRTADPRHRTLRAAVDWSHELLSEEEQTLFRRLSVFAGGWTLEAAEAVCVGECLEEDELLDFLLRLIDKSLVFVTEESGEARYRLLETIRQYGTEKLKDSGEESAVRRRHAEFFLALAEELEPAMWGAEEAAWLGRLEAEHDNLRAALSWAIDQDAELGLRLAGALRWFWYWLGHYGEGRRWLDDALAKGGRASVAARAKALHAVGWLAHDQGDMDRAESAAEEGIELSRKAEIEGRFAASFRNLLGEAARHRGDYQQATVLFEEGTALYREAGDRRGIAWGLFLLGNASSLRGDHERATALYEEGLSLCRELGGAQPLGDYLSHLGYEFLLQGDDERAAALSEEAATLLRNQGYRGGLQFALNNLGWAALVRGDREQAAILHGESLALCRELGDQLVASESIEGLACAAEVRGEAERAARMFGAAQALRESVGYRQVPRGRALREPYLEEVRSKLDVARWDAAFGEGQAMTLGQAVEYALASEEPTAPGEPATPAEAGLAPQKKEKKEATPTLRVFALGAARVEHEGRPLTSSEFGYAKPRELLFYLLSHPPRTREQIGLALWPEASASKLRGSFHDALHRLRKALGGSEWVVHEGGRYSFNRSLGYFFDAQAFEERLEKARRLRDRAPAEAIDHLKEAIELYGGDFLEEFLGSEWVLGKQDELRGAYQETLTELGRLLFSEGHFAEAAKAYRKVISRDRYSEAAHRQLMRCYARMGERGRALKHYESLIELLDEDLGAKPAPETLELYEVVLGQGEEV
jgi:predicted ATPase/DNA-binding SARP family transcriptional activator